MMATDFHRAGTSAQWREHIARSSPDDANVVLAVGTLLAALAAALGGEPGGGFHLYGFSKAGEDIWLP